MRFARLRNRAPPIPLFIIRLRRADSTFFHVRPQDAMKITIRKRYGSRDEIARRYPNLLALIMWQGILTQGEAVAAIAGYRRGLPGASEAVMHYGGARRLLEDATRRRAWIWPTLRANLEIID